MYNSSRCIPCAGAIKECFCQIVERVCDANLLVFVKIGKPLSCSRLFYFLDMQCWCRVINIIIRNCVVGSVSCLSSAVQLTHIALQCSTKWDHFLFDDLINLSTTTRFFVPWLLREGPNSACATVVVIKFTAKNKRVHIESSEPRSCSEHGCSFQVGGFVEFC